MWGVDLYATKYLRISYLNSFPLGCAILILLRSDFFVFPPHRSLVVTIVWSSCALYISDPNCGPLSRIVIEVIYDFLWRCRALDIHLIVSAEVIIYDDQDTFSYGNLPSRSMAKSCYETLGNRVDLIWQADSHDRFCKTSQLSCRSQATILSIAISASYWKFLGVLHRQGPVLEVSTSLVWQSFYLEE